MRVTHPGRVVVALTLFLVVSTTGGVVAGDGAADGASTTEAIRPAADAAQSDTRIVLTQRYALTPERPGSVGLTLTYEIPDRVGSLEVRLLDAATVTDADGFDRVNATDYEWDGSTETARIRLRYNPNETTDRTGPEAADGRYVFADAGEWALLKQFRLRTGWRYTGSSADPVTVERRLRTAGPGATGDQLVYLGPARTVERRANGQRFRLIVPERANLAEPPAAILDALTNASASLGIGDRDERVVAVAAPTGDVEWGVRGVAYAGSEFWVRDIERLDEPDNVWLHEYVHTRQEFRTTAETRWLTEGTAQYYAALLTLEQDRIDFESFRRHLAVGERPAYDAVVLSDPSTWTANANYRKGGLAAGRLDESVRASTNRSATFEDAIRALNRRDSPATQRAFLDAVAAAGGERPRAAAVQYTETAAPLSMWSQRTHGRLFGVLPAQLGYGLPTGSGGYRANGPYRNATVSPTPIRLATGETLTVDAVVRNTGGKAGAYDATLTVDGTPVDAATGTVDAESVRTVRLAHTFERPGEYTVGVGGETVPVAVEAPAEPTVGDLVVDRERVQQGDSAVVTATVRNDAAVPANGTVAFTRNGETVARRPVTLAPGDSTELSAPVELPTAGEIRLGAGTEAVTVTVVPPTGEPTSGGIGAGFTVPVAAAAVLVALLARRVQ